MATITGDVGRESARAVGPGRQYAETAGSRRQGAPGPAPRAGFDADPLQVIDAVVALLVRHAVVGRGFAVTVE
jgi:hypothetical protein